MIFFTEPTEERKQCKHFVPFLVLIPRLGLCSSDDRRSIIQRNTILRDISSPRHPHGEALASSRPHSSHLILQGARAVLNCYDLSCGHRSCLPLLYIEEILVGQQRTICSHTGSKKTRIAKQAFCSSNEYLSISLLLRKPSRYSGITHYFIQ